MTNVHRESAKIYSFPVRGRFAVRAGQDRKGPESKATRATAAALDSAWYHDEAIRETELPRKN
jgi:hypothetical protein